MSDIMINEFDKRDIKESRLYKIDKRLLSILLFDKSTQRNIRWATDNYADRGNGYDAEEPISINTISGINGFTIRPRVSKDISEQELRVRSKAEVFTPSWICNAQNNLIDCAWFNKKTSPFNREITCGWVTTSKAIDFPKGIKKSWQDYVSAQRLEVSCGEAPYLTSRYDSVTGEYIAVKKRIGLLDRKLRVVSENTEAEEDWLKWAETATKSVYGYDWQGDNVLLARENLLYAIVEAYEDKFCKELSTEGMFRFAEIIVWNIWQMDGVNFIVPNSCRNQGIQMNLFGEIDVIPCEGCVKQNIKKHNGIYCRIMDWENNKSVRFVDLVEEGVIYAAERNISTYNSI